MAAEPTTPALATVPALATTAELATVPAEATTPVLSSSVPGEPEPPDFVAGGPAPLVRPRSPVTSSPSRSTGVIMAPSSGRPLWSEEMALRLLHESEDREGDLVGTPWGRPLAGTFERLVVESDLLAGNPLGDPTRRPLYVLRPPGVEIDHPTELPTVYVIQGFTGQLDMWTSRQAFEPTFIERVDELLGSPDCPDAIVVLVDCWTTYGGSQFLDSLGTGRYQSYLCEEVVPFIDERYPTAADRDRRGISGKSSGGYGSMVVPMMRPDVFSALASHSGDALFEVSMAPSIAAAVRTLRDHYESSYDVFFEQLASADRFDLVQHGGPIEMYGYAACYSPDAARPGKALLPFDPADGRRVDDVWQLWLDHDPVRMAPRHGEALRSMRRIHLEAGKGDEYYLDLGAQAFSRELDKLGVEHTLDLFDGKHGGIAYRYPPAIRELLLTLAS